MQRLGAAKHRAHRLERGPDDVVQRLLSRERDAAGLRVEAKRKRPFVGSVETIPHDARPHPSGRAKFRHLLEEVHVGGEEKGEMWAEVIHRQARRLGGLDIRDRVAERESDLLGRGRAGLSDVIAGDGDRVPVGERAAAVSEQVGDQAHRRLRRKDVRPPSRVLLEDVVLHGARDLLRRAPLLLGDQLVKQEQHRRRGVDGHRGRDLVEWNVLEQDFHVLERIDRDTDLADLSVCHGIVRVVADLGGQVEGDRESRLPLLQQELVALVRLRRRAETGVLPHRPQATAVHVLVDAARERKLAGWRFLGSPVLDRIDGLDRQAAVVDHVGHCSTNSVSTPPMLLGWTNAMRLP